MVDDRKLASDGPAAEIQAGQQQPAQQQPAQVQVTPELVAEGVATVAPAGSQGPKVDEGGREPTSIFLFADGTGNSSAKLFKTNVWRLYEALDLGPAKQGQRVQIAYYDNGVGTSNFRPLQLLGGIFGIGLKANVLRLYSFLCQNYQKGDRIYAFGFSRGAFTIRLLVGLIATQGIILKQGGEAPPKYQIRDAYREVCRNLRPNRWPRWLARAVKGIRDQFLDDLRITLRRKKYSELERHQTDIEFVGVWDTVAAYGGPFAELTRGIDDWVWPLTMPDYGLSPRVKKARHALSLDDERDAFQPLLWDEHRERQLIESGARVMEDGRRITRRVDKDRLAQVWFSGVHSDVGGGYPDESLSYISLLWMMDELSPPDTEEVHFIDSFVQRARDLANPYGPIHDSRAGIASYYRYQPRKIAAMTDPADQRYIALRDPAIGMAHPYDYLLRDRFRALVRATGRKGGWGAWLRWPLHAFLRAVEQYDRSHPLSNTALRAILSLVTAGEAGRIRAWRGHGLLKRVRVHETAIARIISGIDSYAPAALPANFEIDRLRGPRSEPAMTSADYDSMDRARPREAERFARQERAWNMVWARRGVYFTTAFVSLALILLPSIYEWTQGIEALCGDDRCFAKNLLEKPAFLLPSLVAKYWGLYLAAPFTLIVGIILLFGLMGGGETLERTFRGKVRTIWRETIGGAPAPANEDSTWQRIRESRPYQTALFDLKWRVLPGILGLATLAALLLLAALVVTQSSYALAEKGSVFCSDGEVDAAPRRQLAPVPLAASSSCTDLKVRVSGNHRYRIRLTDVKHWADGANPASFPWTSKGYPATPENGVVNPSGPLSWSWPFARVTRANFLEPLTEVRNHHPQGLAGHVRQWALGPDIDINQTDFRPADGGYEMAFCPKRDGKLYLMLNDTGLTYGNNRGSAMVEVLDLGPRDTGKDCAPLR